MSIGELSAPVLRSDAERHLQTTDGSSVTDGHDSFPAGPVTLTILYSGTASGAFKAWMGGRDPVCRSD